LRSVNHITVQEGQTGIIKLKAAEKDHPDLSDDDPRAVKLMIDYLYLDDYDPKTASAVDPVPHVENGKVEESVVERAVEVAQTYPVHSDHWSSNAVVSTGFGTAPSVFGGTNSSPRSIFSSAAPAAFGAPSTAFGHPSQPQLNEDFSVFGGSKKKGKKGKSAAAEPPPDSFLEMHAKVFAIASKYDIKSLERVAREKFKDQSKGDWLPADLIAAIDVVFNGTPEPETELRNALKDAIVRCAITMVQHPGFEESVAHINGLAYALFRRKTYVHG
jgi:hypothetical protein